MKTPITVPIEALIEEPYASIVCYPRTNPTEIQKHIVELRQHEVSAVEFTGKTSASNIPVLGKGYVGVVVIAHVKEHRVALKMRRIDADRPDFIHEAQMLQKANAIRQHKQQEVKQNPTAVARRVLPESARQINDWVAGSFHKQTKDESARPTVGLACIH